MLVRHQIVVAQREAQIAEARAARGTGDHLLN